MIIQKSNTGFSFFSFQGNTPTPDQLQQELEKMYQYLTKDSADTVNQLNSYFATLSASSSGSGSVDVSMLATKAELNALRAAITAIGGTGASGPAGGDLAGTYPNPSLVALGASLGPIGDATHVAVVTIDDKGRVTALSAVPITGGGGGSAAGGHFTITATTAGLFTIPYGVTLTAPSRAHISFGAPNGNTIVIVGNYTRLGTTSMDVQLLADPGDMVHVCSWDVYP